MRCAREPAAGEPVQQRIGAAEGIEPGPQIAKHGMEQHNADPPDGPDGQRQGILQRIARAHEARGDEREQDQGAEEAGKHRRNCRHGAKAQPAGKGAFDEPRGKRTTVAKDTATASAPPPIT